MKASELIEELERLINLHGDVKVFSFDFVSTNPEESDSIEYNEEFNAVILN